jgi:hypothetical protein
MNYPRSEYKQFSNVQLLTTLKNTLKTIDLKKLAKNQN